MAPAGAPQVPQVGLVVALEIGLYLRRRFFEELREALDSPVRIP